MEGLVDREFNVLGLLIRIFENNIASDYKNLIYCASFLCCQCSLRLFGILTKSITSTITITSKTATGILLMMDG